MSALSNISLFLAALFTLLLYLTSRDSVYEMVDGDIVSTRVVFLIFSIVCFGFWIALEFKEYF